MAKRKNKKPKPKKSARRKPTTKSKAKTKKALQTKRRQVKPKQIKRLKPDHYVIYRDRKGRIRKPRKDTLLVAEVRSRKSKRRVGFLNSIDKKRKTPEPRRFTSTQRAMYERRFIEKLPEKRRQPSDLEFTVYSSDFIKNQIPTRVVDRIRDEINLQGYVKLGIEIWTNKGERIVSDAVYWDDENMLASHIETHLFLSIVNASREMMVRASPKKYARNPKERRREIRRAIHVRVIFYGI